MQVLRQLRKDDALLMVNAVGLNNISATRGGRIGRVIDLDHSSDRIVEGIGTVILV